MTGRHQANYIETFIDFKLMTAVVTANDHRKGYFKCNFLCWV